MNAFKSLWTNRSILRDVVKREIETKYKNSVLGKVWILLHHISLIAIYTFVFSFILQTKLQTSKGDLGQDFSLWLYCGLLPWLAMSESFNGAIRDIVSKVNYVKKVVFPLEVLPISSAVIAMINKCLGLILLFLGLIVFGDGLSFRVLFLPLIIVPLFLSLSGISLILSALGVYFRDLAQLIGVIMMLWLYATPILYTVDMIPERFSWIFNLNPLTKIVDFYRDILFWGRDPDFMFLLLFFVSSVVLFAIGYRVFKKLQRGFADVL